MKSTAIQQMRLELEQKLAQSAFRRGISAFRLGLIPMGISDHLPIAADIRLSAHTEISLISWNLLADSHLHNNFMNISGLDKLISAILVKLPEGCIYYRANENRMIHFFSELAQFLYQNQDHGIIMVDEQLLNRFTQLKHHPSRLCRSSDPEKMTNLKEQVETARKIIVDILLDQTHPDAHEFKLAIRHSLECIYHIQAEKGALKWSNRFTYLKQNKQLIHQLIHTDIVCLQECSNPMDIHQLITETGKEIQMLTHRINESTDDHCVIVYDSHLFEMRDPPLFVALEGKKPCIFVKLAHRTTQEVFIVASIHHPGGNQSCLHEFFAAINTLSLGGERTIPYYIAGDYNHKQAFFTVPENSCENHCMVYPQCPTMAGSDYGHLNQSIDAIMTNQPENSVRVQRLNDMVYSAPAQSPLIVRFVEAGQPLNYASPRFFPAVTVPEPQQFASNHTGDPFALSSANLVPPIKL